MGAILAGVDYVLIGAGIPRNIPAVLTKLAQNEDAEYRLNVAGTCPEDHFKLEFSPRMVSNEQRPDLFRPEFIGIISSTVLGLTLTKKTSPPVDGLVIEAPTAGGHNAPPRGKPQFNGRGEPIYGERDEVDLKAIADLGIPFWLAGNYGSPQGLREAIKAGAAGIQVGTAFALCDESGMERKLKDQMIGLALSNELDVFTDPLASPTGFPFKVAKVPGTLSTDEVYAARTRRCDLGYLREPYKKDDGTIGYRCPSEPIDQYVKKGGLESQTKGKKCLCNALMSNIGLSQSVSGSKDKPLITIGDDAKDIARFLKGGCRTYRASDVISTLSKEI